MATPEEELARQRRGVVATVSPVQPAAEIPAAPGFKKPGGVAGLDPSVNYTGGFMPGTRAVMRSAGADISQAASQGNYGGAAGQLIRATAATPLAIAEDVLAPAVNLANRGIAGLRDFGAVVTTGNSDAKAGPLFGSTASQPIANTATTETAPRIGMDTSPAVMSGVTPSGVGGVGGLGGISYDPATKTYSGNVVGANAQITGGRGGGAISSQNMGAANALAATSQDESAGRVKAAGVAGLFSPNVGVAPPPPPESTGGFGILSKDYQDRRNAGFDLSSITASRAEKRGALVNLAGLEAQKTQRVVNAGSARGFDVKMADAIMRNQVSNAQLGINGLAAFSEAGLRKAQEARLGVQGLRDGAEIGSMQRQEAAAMKLAAAATPETQAAAERELLALQGKVAPRGGFTAVNLPDSVSDQGVRMGGGQVLVRSDGTQIPIGQAAKAAAAPAVGTVSTVNGKQAVYDGTQWIPR